jgi:hypothetical protein
MLRLLTNLLNWHPPVGVFIAILALLGVLVPLLREKIGKREKAVWTALMFALLLMELRSIQLDHDDQLKARQKQDEQFSAIAGGLKDTVTTAQQQFQTTMNRMERLASLSNKNIDAVTGGNGFVYVDIMPPPVDQDGVSFVAFVKGSNNIREVRYAMQEGCSPHEPTAAEFNDTLAGRIGSLKKLPDMAPTLAENLNIVKHPPRTSVTCYLVEVFALNGAVHETLNVRFDPSKNRWTRFITVANGKGKTVWTSPWY